MNFPNIVLADGPMGYADVGAALEASATSWEDFKWIRDAWGGPIVAKGVHTADDARKAVDHGAAAIVVSNHGARQLDGVAADDPRAARSGAGRQRPDRDPARRRHPPRQRHRQGALHGRARGLIGRAYAYGLGAGGQAGVARAIEHPQGRRHPDHETAGLSPPSKILTAHSWTSRPSGPPACRDNETITTITVSRPILSEFCHVITTC